MDYNKYNQDPLLCASWRPCARLQNALENRLKSCCCCRAICKVIWRCVWKSVVCSILPNNVCVLEGGDHCE